MSDASGRAFAVDGERTSARAKVNLTLRVLGRRPDGYHELESLVAFPDGPADDVTMGATTRGYGRRGPRAPAVTLRGPFATAVVGENIVARALDRLLATAPDMALGPVVVEKQLPVAAGLGGGSADAAAVLRLARARNPDLAGTIDWAGLARSLGADVPVCLEQQLCLMRGTGERLQPVVRAGARVPILLVMADTPVPADKTAQVFRRLAAPPRSVETDDGPQIPMIEGPRALIDIARSIGNDLTAPSVALFPMIAEALAELQQLSGCRLAQMSGAGPTCFGLFEDAASCSEAARRLRTDWPRWWVAAGTV